MLMHCDLVQASTQSNTYVVSGKGEVKKMQDLLPGIINQLGPEHLSSLKQFSQAFSQSGLGATATSADDDDIPELVENFEEVSQQK